VTPRQTETLARKLVIALYEITEGANKGMMLSTMAKELDVEWYDVEAAAILAQEHGWLRHQVHSVTLNHKGQLLALAAAKKKR
jgi:hypothetical protein